MRKVLFAVLLMFLLSSVSLASATEDTGFLSPEQGVQASATEYQICSDDIRWRYKTENGHTCKRLYNYTKKAWIGSWILVA